MFLNFDNNDYQLRQQISTIFMVVESFIIRVSFIMHASIIMICSENQNCLIASLRA